MSALLTVVRVGGIGDFATGPAAHATLVSVMTDGTSLSALLERFPHPGDGGPAHGVDQHLVALLDAARPAWAAIADVLVLHAREAQLLDDVCTGWAVAVVRDSDGDVRVLTRAGWSADLVKAAGAGTAFVTLASYGSLVHAWQVGGRRLEDLDDAVLSVGRDRRRVRSRSCSGRP
ncbi:hypothetical protein [Actinocorallia sp. A-T 12471]|uniref:hypothetical protein n=1 Tax=Actinocorallia sp. A-T 12471 TaxID=3089813 RepID=UPI0029D3C124|nr:hypothetical protein [Actinocorallia sp. A-T 12471]MDX6740584.1 hypothetical protein [Actinocorallia sp. A-T 12471]